MPVNRLCPLCGVLIKPVAWAEPPISQRWLQEIRVVRSTDGISCPFVSGVGYLSADNIIRAHSDPALCYADDPESLEFHLLFHRSREYWAIPMHNSCWEILCFRLSDCDISVIAKNLFHILLSTPYNSRGWSSPGHDFGGAAQFHHADPDHRDLLQLKVLPEDLPEAIPRARSSEADSSVSSAHSAHWQSGERSFSRLPVEVIHLILAWLPLKEVAQLRLASRTIRHASTVNELPAAFWLSRFTPDLEMGFAKPRDYEHQLHSNWRDLFFTVRHALRSPDGHLQLKNRKRVWTLLGPISDVLRYLLKHRHVCGVSIAWNDLSPLLQHWEAYPYLGRVITGEVVPIEQEELMDVGCRQLHVRSVVWPGMLSSGGCTIKFSVVSINSQTFISGICVVPSSQSYTRETDYRGALGLTSQSSQTRFSIQATEILQGFEVAVNASGIVGLRVLIGGQLDRCSEWAGDIGTGGSEVAFGRLIPENGRQIFAIAAGFDAFKMTSIRLIQTPLAHEASDSLGSYLRYKPRSSFDDYIWTPQMPHNVRLLTRSLMTPGNQRFNPILNMDFGGPRGCMLNSLSRVVVTMRGKPALVTGIEFFYSNGKTTFFGSRGGIELLFLINGAGGERINEVETERTAAQGVHSFQLTTNWGNKVAFGFQKQGRPLDKVECETLKAPEGEIITGFFAAIWVRHGSFLTFGLQVQSLDPVPRLGCPPQRLPISMNYSDSPAPDTGISAMHSRDGTAVTSVSLCHVCCMRFSMGVTGRSRTGYEISGIWLNYYHLARPAIAGQWLSEVDSFELDQNEQVTEVSVWFSAERVSQRGRAEVGRVIGLLLVTSGLRRKCVITRSLAGAHRMNFRANRFEDLDTLIWAFNTRRDHFRVLTCPAMDHLSLLLCPEPSPPWLVPEKALWEEIGSDGTPLRLLSIKGHLEDGAITGLTFLYDSDLVCKVGFTESDTYQMMIISQHEKLIRLEVRSYNSNIRGVTFKTEDSQGEDRRGRSFEINPIRPEELPTHHLHIFELVASQDGVAHPPEIEMVNCGTHIKHYKCPPNAIFAGFWGYGVKLRGLGVLFESPRKL